MAHTENVRDCTTLSIGNERKPLTERADEERNSISEEDLIEGWACLPVTSHAFMSPTPGDVDHDSCGDCIMKSKAIQMRYMSMGIRPY